MATILAQLGNITAAAISDLASRIASSFSAEIETCKADDATNLAAAKSYTDQKITDLVNGAPETLDTLKEIADEIENNETALEAITQAVQNHTHPVATETTNGFMAAADKANLDSTLTNVETIQEDLTANTATLASHTDTLASHTDTLDFHTSTLSSHTSTIKLLRDEEKLILARVDTAEDDIVALQTNQTADEATLASHTSTLSSHTSTLSSHTSTLSSHSSSLSTLTSTKLTTTQLYAGTANLISKPDIAKIASTLTSSAYVQPKNTTQGAYAVSWTFTGPSDTYNSSSSASSGVIQFLNSTFCDSTSSYIPCLSHSTLATSGSFLRYLWVSFYVDDWTADTPPVNCIQLGGPSSSDSWIWAWNTSTNAYAFKSGYIQVSDSTRRYFWGFSSGSYTTLYLYRTTLSCRAAYPGTHTKTVTIYRPMVSIGTCLADWAPSPIDQFC